MSHEIDRRREERFARFAPNGPDRRMSKADRWISTTVFVVIISLIVLERTLDLGLFG